VGSLHRSAPYVVGKGAAGSSVGRANVCAGKTEQDG